MNNNKLHIIETNRKKNKIRLTESQLRYMIRKCINEALNEHDDDEYDYYEPSCDRSVSSSCNISFDPKTFDYEYSDDDMDHKNFVLDITSSDFPDSYYHETSATYWQPAEYDEYIGECGGDFDWELASYPEEEYTEDEALELAEKFIKAHKGIIIETLGENAEWD